MMSRLQRDTRLSRYQKGRTNLDFTEASDIGWQWHQLQDYASLHLAPDDHAITPPLSVFYRPDCPVLPPNQQRQSTEGKQRR